MAKHLSVIAINTSAFLIMTGVGLIVALLPQKIINLSGSVSDVGLLASIYAIPVVLLQIPIGNLSDRFGSKLFLVGGYILCGLSGILYFLADSQPLYFVGRFMQGMAEVPIWALAPALLSIQYAAEKGKFMGMYNACIHFGLTTGGLLSIVISKFLQGNEPFLLFAALSLLGGLITALFVENRNVVKHDGFVTMETRGILTMLTNRTNLIICFGIGLYGAGYGIFITIIPAFLIDVKDVTQTGTGIFFALFYIALSISQLFAGAWSDRNGRQPTMVVGLFAMALGTGVFHICDSALMLVFLTIAGLGLGIFCVSSMAFLNERAPESHKGTISGAYFFFWGGGYFSAPLMIGRISPSIGYQASFYLMSGLYVLQLIIIKRCIKNQKTPVLQK